MRSSSIQEDQEIFALSYEIPTLQWSMILGNIHKT